MELLYFILENKVAVLIELQQWLFSCLICSGFTPSCGGDDLSNNFLFAFHRAEEEVLYRHEALADQTLGAAGALEALRLGVPMVLAVGNPLGLGLHSILAR